MRVERGSGNSEKLSTVEMFGTPIYHENIADPSATRLAQLGNTDL